MKRATHLKHARMARWNSDIDKENVHAAPVPKQTETSNRVQTLLPLHEANTPQAPPQLAPLAHTHQPRPTISPPPATALHYSRSTVPPTQPASTPHQSRPAVLSSPPATTQHQYRPIVPPTQPATTLVIPHTSRPTVPPSPSASTPYTSRLTVEVDCLNKNRIINLGNLSSAVQTITHHATECGGECCVTGESYSQHFAGQL